MSAETALVLYDVGKERAEQDYKWGEQNHPDGTIDDERSRRIRDSYRKRVDDMAEAGEVTWASIFTEESLEALAETDPVKLREELVQVAAVAVAWIEAIDRRGEEEEYYDPDNPYGDS